MKLDMPTDDVPVVVLTGDSLAVIPQLPEYHFDAVVTDPPYSSGGAFRGDRTQSTITKYVKSGQQHSYADFGGDTRDQRSFFAWSSLWLSAARGVCKPGAPLCCFIDWRQLPVMTDAVQAGGWTWRNIATWWKPGVRMQKGRFSSSAEYIVYATNGANDSDGEAAQQNVFSCQPVPSDDKSHIAEKPLAVMNWILSVTPPGALVLDPFGGSGATAVACVASGRKCVVVEQDPSYAAVIRRRVADVIGKNGLFRNVKAGPATLFTEAGAA